MANIPEKIETKICVHCHSHLKQNKWVDIGLSREEVVRKVILDKISFNPKVKNPKTEIDIIQRKGTLYKCLVKIKGEVFGKNCRKNIIAMFIYVILSVLIVVGVRLDTMKQ